MWGSLAAGEMAKRRSVYGWIIRSKLVWLAGVFLLVGLMVLAADVTQWAREWRFWRGASAQGTVVGTDAAPSRQQGIKKSRTYSVVYEFPTGEGITAQGVSDIPAFYGAVLKPGDRVRVAYLREAPENNRLAYSLDFLPALILLLLGAAFTVLGALAEYFILREIYRKHA